MSAGQGSLGGFLWRAGIIMLLHMHMCTRIDMAPSFLYMDFTAFEADSAPWVPDDALGRRQHSKDRILRNGEFLASHASSTSMSAGRDTCFGFPRACRRQVEDAQVTRFDLTSFCISLEPAVV